jgi:putative solute:sodium symporter small subunit
MRRMGDAAAQEKYDPRVLALKGGLLAVWVLVTFVCAYFARDLQFMVGNWPFGFWMAAQGCVLVFIVLLVVYAVCMKRLVPGDSLESDEDEHHA